MTEKLALGADAFRAWFEAVADAYVVFSPDLRIIACTEAYLKQTGTTLDDVLGKPVFDVFPTNPDLPASEDGVAILRSALERTIALQTPVALPTQRYDIPVRSATLRAFEERYWNALITPIKDDNGVLTSVLMKIEDITELTQLKSQREDVDALALAFNELKAANEQLEQAHRQVTASETLFRLAMESTPVGMALVGLDGRFLRVNDALTDLIGYTEAETLQMSFVDVTEDEYRDRDIQAREAMINGELPSYRVEKKYVRKDGSRVWIALHSTLVRNESGTPVYFVSQMQDITAQRQLLDALTRSNEDLRTFAYVASHDLQSPLLTIRGFTEMFVDSLDDGSLSEEQHRMAEHIIAGANQMQELIADVLAYGQLDMDARPAEDVSIAAVHTDVVSMLSADATAAKATFACLATDTVRVQPGQLRQVMQNLLQNTLIHRTPDRNPIVTTSSRVLDDGFIEITVADNGPGIPPEGSAKIFEMFQQVDRRQGHGVGLAIVKRVVERHGGTIVAESDGRTGTTFRFTLPQT